MSLANFGSPGTPTSQLVQTPGLNISPADVTSATATENKALSDSYAAKQQQYSNMMSGLMGIPSAVLGGWAKSGGLQSAGAGLGSMFGGGAEAAGNSALIDAMMPLIAL